MFFLVMVIVTVIPVRLLIYLTQRPVTDRSFCRFDASPSTLSEERVTVRIHQSLCLLPFTPMMYPGQLFEEKRSPSGTMFTLSSLLNLGSAIVAIKGRFE